MKVTIDLDDDIIYAIAQRKEEYGNQQTII